MVPPDVMLAAGAVPACAGQGADTAVPNNAAGCDPRSSFPYGTSACNGGETAALAHLAQYLARKLPHSYKATRNGLTGLHYSSKFSPWLASGALSARQVFVGLKAFEREHGANDGTYWLWFELLWRDYFGCCTSNTGRRCMGLVGFHSCPRPRTTTRALSAGARAARANRWSMPPCASWPPPGI